MQYIQLASTDLRLSRLAFGTAALHHHFEAKIRQELLACAFDNGITHFDTAPYYGHGLAEVAVGHFLQGQRTTVTVTTKVGLYPRVGMAYNSIDLRLRKMVGKVIQPLAKPLIDWSLTTSEKSLHASLKRLGTDYIDILLLHEPDMTLINSVEYEQWLEKQKALGKIRCWGIAGEVSRVQPWVSVSHPVAMIIQTRDDMSSEFSQILSCTQKLPQITYGYLSALRQFAPPASAVTVMKAALQRNAKGVILFSSSKCNNIETMAKLLS